MGLRELLNGQPLIAGAAVAVIAAGAVFYSYKSVGWSSRPEFLRAAYYSTDDGKTWFKESSDRIVPFDYDGKEAVKAYVFECPDQGKFVGFLERLTPKAKADLQTLKDNKQLANTQAILTIFESGTEVKKPGDKTWVLKNSPQGQSVNAVCKSGQAPTQVLP